MKLKLAALSLAFLALTMAGCDKEEDQTIFTKNGSPMTGAQVVPSNTVSTTTAATGTIDASYDKRFKLLTYTVKWSGLTAAPLPTVISSSVPVQAGLYIHGPADPGFLAPPTNSAATPPLLYLQAPIPTTTTLGTSGTYTNTLYADGIKVKEEDILANKLYVVLRTNATTQPATSGEIRGQIKVQ